jgi:chaperonin GroES
MNVRPLRDRLLVSRIEEQEQKVGGIIIPDTAKEKPQQGRVVAAGKGRINDKGDVFPLDVKSATSCCSANTPALRSKSTEPNT